MFCRDCFAKNGCDICINIISNEINTNLIPTKAIQEIIVSCKMCKEELEWLNYSKHLHECKEKIQSRLLNDILVFDISNKINSTSTKDVGVQCDILECNFRFY